MFRWTRSKRRPQGPCTAAIVARHLDEYLDISGTAAVPALADAP
jgi:hypothetical protein